MLRGRYISRAAGDVAGILRAPLVKLDGVAMTLNVDSWVGTTCVQALASDGKVLPGFALADCEPVKADAVAAPLGWKRSLSVLRVQTVRWEFTLRNGGCSDSIGIVGAAL